MNARIVTTGATLFTAFAGVLTIRAADSQLLSLVMPDAKVLAGVNVDQAKASPFGLYVLTQIQSNNSDLQKLITLTGFDPTRDVHEVLAATNATPGSKSPVGLVLGLRGNFNVSADRLVCHWQWRRSPKPTVGRPIVEDLKKTAAPRF